MGIHDGHRARMKRRLRESGADSFDDHQLLEMLLFYAIPRSDVNIHAHRLLEHFGSLDRVFEATVDELCRVEGIGEHTATLLHLVPQIERRYQIRRNNGLTKVNSVDQAGRYLLPYFRYEKEEVVYMLCLDVRRRVICCKLLARGEVDCASISVRKVSELAISRKATGVILAHNHTSGVALPSAEDCYTTRMLRDGLAALGIQLLDHLVVSGADFVSMASTGELD